MDKFFEFYKPKKEVIKEDQQTESIEAAQPVSVEVNNPVFSSLSLMLDSLSNEIKEYVKKEEVEQVAKALIEHIESIQNTLKKDLVITSSDLKKSLDSLQSRFSNLEYSSEELNKKNKAFIFDTFSEQSKKFNETLTNVKEELSGYSSELLNESLEAYKQEIENYRETITKQEISRKKLEEQFTRFKEHSKKTFNEEKYLTINQKISHLEKVLETFNEKTILTEGVLDALPSTKTSDPLTPSNQNLVTQEQLKQHYQLFINRIQQQLTSLGGGGAGWLKDLNDVNYATLLNPNDGDVLTYNLANNQWEAAVSTGGGGGGSITKVAGVSSGQVSNVQLYFGVKSSGLLDISNISGPVVNTINGITGDVELYTSNISEVNNLYFTNARARSAITAGTGIIYNSSNGHIAIGQAVGDHDDVTFANVTITGNLLVQGNSIVFDSNTIAINDPLLQVGKNPVGDTVDLGFFGHYVTGDTLERHAGLFRDASDGQFKLFANLYPEPATIVATGDASYESANLVVNYLVGKVTDISNHSTTNLSEGTNLYYSNDRVSANVATLGYSPNTYVNVRLLTKANTADLTTDNVSEVNNLYFTNTRAIGALTAGQNITIAANGLITANVSGGGGGGGAVDSVNGLVGTVQLYTANIPESGNLYFTNERAISSLTAGQGIVLESNGLIVSTATGTVTEVNGQTGNVSLTTSNISEGSNLYYSNSRVYDNVTKLGYITSSSLNGYATNSQLGVYATNSQLALYSTNAQLSLYATNSQLSLYATNVQLSVYATNAQLATYATNAQLGLYATNSQLSLYSTNAQLATYATLANINLKANTSDLTTANVLEVNNLYFTNARSREAITAGTGIIYSTSNGYIAIGQAVGDHDDVTFANVTITGNLLVQGNSITFDANTLAISDPLIQVGKNPTGDTVDLGFFGHYIGGDTLERHAGLFRDASDGQFKLFSNLFPEPATIVATGDVSYEKANLVVNYLVGKVTDISDHTTTELAEGTNLYYSNDRVSANVATLGYSSNAYVNSRLLTKANTSDLNTSNVTEGTNLYYTNARVYSNVIQLNYITSAALGGYATNNQLSVYATNAQLATYATNAQLTLYATNAQLATYATNAQLSLYATNVQISTKANISDLNTSNVVEGTNLYYTNARVSANVATLGYAPNTYVTTRLLTKANTSDLTTANVVEVNNLYFTDARVEASIASQTLLNATFTGEVVASLLTSTQSIGDEGGQLTLANAQTNQSLSGNIAIDIYQNRLRIFEVAGTNRGVYIDFTAASTGVGTNLLSGPAAGGIKSATIVDPTAAENFTMFFTQSALTIVKAQAVVQGINPNVVVTVSSSTNRTTPTTNNIVAFSVSNTTTGNNVTVTNSTIAANSWVWMTTTAVSGTANSVSVTLIF